MIKSDEEIEQAIMAVLGNRPVEFKSESPEADRQKVYRVLKRIIEEHPLLGAIKVIVRVRDKEWIVLEPRIQERTLELRTAERPKKTEVAAKSKLIRMPKWLEAMYEDFKATREKAAANPEYREAFMDLDTRVIACERLGDIIAEGENGADLERYIKSGTLDDLDRAFRGEHSPEIIEPIELLRLQIADIPIDDEARAAERLELIERRERLMLERDQRLNKTDPELGI